MKRILAIGCVSVILGVVVWIGIALLLQPKPETVLYSRANGEDLYLDLYRPKPEKSLHRAIVIVHGGGWTMGNKHDMAAIARAFVDKGFVCASVQYRFAPKYRWPAQLDDVQTAVRFLRANAAKYQFDPNNIGAIGGSAGGHLVQCLGVRDTRDPNPKEYPQESSRVQAVWNVFGPNDLTQTYSVYVTKLIKGLVGEMTPERLKDASPVFFADRNSAPTFFMQGTADTLIPWQQAQEMSDKLKSVGVEADLNLIEGMGHGVDMKNPVVEKTVIRAIDWMQIKLSAPSQAKTNP